MLVGFYLLIGVFCAIAFFLSPYFLCYVSAFEERDGDEIALSIVSLAGFLIIVAAWLPLFLIAIAYRTCKI